MIITVALTTGGGFREGIAPHSVFAVDDGRRGLSCQSLHETREGLSVCRCAQVCRTAPPACPPAPAPASPLAGAHAAWSSRQSPRELCRVKGSAAVVNPDDQ